MDFPLYRKYANNRTFFKINNRQEFEELNLIGNKYTFRIFEAKILPDRNLIEDMILLHNNHWKESDATEFQSMLAHCRNHLEKM